MRTGSDGTKQEAGREAQSATRAGGGGGRTMLHDEHFYLTYSKLRLTTTTIRVATTTEAGYSLSGWWEGGETCRRKSQANKHKS